MSFKPRCFQTIKNIRPKRFFNQKFVFDQFSIQKCCPPKNLFNKNLIGNNNFFTNICFKQFYLLGIKFFSNEKFLQLNIFAEYFFLNSFFFNETLLSTTKKIRMALSSIDEKGPKHFFKKVYSILFSLK